MDLGKGGARADGFSETRGIKWSDTNWEQAWPRACGHGSRLAAGCGRAGLVESPLCPRCGEEAEDVCHRVWTCSANVGEIFVPRATQDKHTLACFWLRGMVLLRLDPTHFETKNKETSGVRRLGRTPHVHRQTVREQMATRD